ncbi:MAG: homoserine kinase [Steroidobacteraceae bacterium]|nr:homoserine kinase [Steroidobacteraceae bacterium]
MSLQSATAFAPATVGNVGIGFDILGHTFPAIGDRVRAIRVAQPGVRITEITGIAAELPVEVARNTAGKAVLSLVESQTLPFGIDLAIEKGIPLGSGLGGSAASAVAAVVAANELLNQPLTRLELLKHAIQGEAVASGSLHADNIAPSLFGGLVLTVGIDNPRIKQIPVPPGIRCVLVHPQLYLSTREARAILNRTVNLSDVVWQTANLAGFLAGCYTNDLDLIRNAFEDVLIEPQRARLIPGFAEVKRSAMEGGALGCSISGAGPSVFAWALESQAEAIGSAMLRAFERQGLACDHWIAQIGEEGARVVERQ